jgi:type IV secretory pathway TrbF-like protein
MSATVGDLNPKTLENAKRQFVELYGSALVLNTYLKIALVLVSLVAVGLVGLNFHTAARASQIKPLIIRIDDVGRAEAVEYDATRYQPHGMDRQTAPARGIGTLVRPRLESARREVAVLNHRGRRRVPLAV